jgi:kynureninase
VNPQPPTQSPTQALDQPSFKDDREWARAQDAADPLSALRSEFLIPRAPAGGDALYFAGHSLGLQPRRVRELIGVELDDWARLGVEGHFAGRNPWMGYHELLTASTARLVGALPQEVVVMNTLTVNLHLMMASFYRPTRERFRILVEAGAFPSDQYAVASQARWHGLDPKAAILELRPRPGESLLRMEDVAGTIEEHGRELALVMLGIPNYLTGQALDRRELVRLARAQGCAVGFDLAHGAGNLRLQLHDEAPDFAVWCNYKYLNAGPGGLGGAFVHQQHARNPALPRLAGWWGHDKATRFQMGPEFVPIEGAEGWQLSNPPIFQLAALRASMELYDRAGMEALRARGDRLTGYLEWLLDQLPSGAATLLTPRDPARRGSMLTLRISRGARGGAKELVESLAGAGALADLRNPDIVRLAPSPLYGSLEDVQRVGGLVRAFFAGGPAGPEAG